MRDCILRLSMYWLRVWGSGAQRLWTSPHPELVPLRALPPKLTWLDRQRLLIVELLRLGVQGAALLDYLEAGQLQSLACLLALGRLLLADNPAVLVLGQVLRCQATNGLCLASTKHHDLGKDALPDLAHRLLLHCLHRLHGLHRLRHC